MKNIFAKDSLTVDLKLSYIGLFIGSIFAFICYILNFSFIDVSLTLFFACLAYLVIKSKNIDKLEFFKYQCTKRVIILNLFFTALTLILINEIYLFNNIIFLYFIIVILSCLTMIEFISTPPKNTYCSLTLLKILIIALILRWNVYFQYPSYIGVDAWYHSAIIADIIESGHLPLNYTYSKYPIMHLLVSLGSLLSNITIKNSMAFTVGLFEIISLIYVFLIGKSVSSMKTGILATFLVAVSGYHISWGYFIIPMTLGLSIFSAIFYLLFRKNSLHLSFFRVIILLLSFLMIMVHTISTLVTSLSIVLLYIFDIVCKIHFKKDRSLSLASLSLVFTILISMIGYWMFASGFIGYVILSVKSSLMMSEVSSIVANPILANSIERQLNRIELLLFLGFSIIGSFFWISEKNDDYRRLILIAIGAVITLITFFSIFIGVDSILPDRWYVFLYIIIANISSAGIIYTVTSFKNDNLMTFSLVIVMAVFTTFAITGAAANGGSAAYSEVPIKQALTESELHSFNTISRIYSGDVTTDIYSEMYFEYIAKLPIKNFEPYNLIEDHGLTILRIHYLKTSLVSIPIADRNKQGYGGYSGTLINLKDLNLDLLYGERYSKIYNSGSVYGFIK